MKSMLAAKMLLYYPDHNLSFQIYTDLLDYQMGAIIMQNSRVFACWSCKLNEVQKNYTMQEKELLAIVYCLQEFHTMLLDAKITVFTDHKNLTFKTLNTQRVLQWRLFLEDFSPTLVYHPGKENVLADCFSRLPQMGKPTEGKKSNKGKLLHLKN